MEGSSEKGKAISFGENCPGCGECVTHGNAIFHKEDNIMKYTHSCGQRFNELINGKIYPI